MAATVVLDKLKYILTLIGVSDFSDLDDTLAGFFCDSILDGTLSESELIDILTALCPEINKFPVDSMSSHLSTIARGLMEANTCPNDISEEYDNQNVSTYDIKAAKDQSKSELSEQFDRSCTSPPSDQASRLEYFEASLISTQLKKIFKRCPGFDSLVNTIENSPFETSSIIHMIKIVKRSDNMDVNYDIVNSYFPFVGNDNYLLDSVVRLLKSSKVVQQDTISMKQPDFEECDHFDSEKVKSDLMLLAEMFSEIPPHLVRYVYKDLCAENLARAGETLLEAEPSGLHRMWQDHDSKQTTQSEQERRIQERLRDAVVKTHSEREVAPKYDKNGKELKPKPPIVFMSTEGGGNQKVRYRDGQVVSHKGEKTIIIKNPHDDYDGGSRGMVKPKGKRGPGWIKS